MISKRLKDWVNQISLKEEDQEIRETFHKVAKGMKEQGMNDDQIIYHLSTSELINN